MPSRSRKTTAEVLELERLADSASDVRQVTMGHRVFLSIKRAIVHGRLVPGYPVSEAELAGQLGVSRQPVREAFIKLADMGLVEIRPQRGTFIQRISRREVENARFLREAIEVAIARRAAEVASAEAVRPLWDLVEDPADTIVSQHRILVQAIADRSPDAAEAAMRHHLREMLKSLPIVIENNADAFDL